MTESRLADPSLLILCYHAVSEPWLDVGAVGPRELGRQLRAVLSHGYRPLTLSAALREPRGRRTVVVSFDDAFDSVLERGLPVLSELGVPATLFVPTDFASAAGPMTWSNLRRWVGTEHERELRCMSWEEIRRLADAGWEIGSHTCSHPDLTALDEEDAMRELRRSKEVCEASLQRPCSTLAYPFGAHDSRVAALAEKAGYEAAVTLAERLLSPLGGDSPFRLPRDGVYRTTPDWQLALAISPVLRRVRARLRVQRM